MISLLQPALLPDQTEMSTKQPSLLQKSSSLSSPWTNPPKFLFYNPHHLAYLAYSWRPRAGRNQSNTSFVHTNE